METRSADNRIWTRVSEDGKSAAAGVSLEPADAETRQRLKEMNRDGFWIHKGTTPTASKGCILLPDETRKRIPAGSILRVRL